MMTLCLRYTKNETDAMEVLNTGFYKVFKNIRKYDVSKGSLYTWIRKIIINSCLDLIKKKGNDPGTRQLVEVINIDLSPEVISKMSAAELLKLVRQLSPSTQAVFNLYVLEGYSHKEIASIMKISEGTSKWRLNEARKKLQKMINDREKVNE
jgi:RNA polymerase sigma-70 factor (ECF subfamily)